MKLDDENWHCFTLSRYDRGTGKVGHGEGAGLPHHRLRFDASSAAHHFASAHERARDCLMSPRRKVL